MFGIGNLEGMSPEIHATMERALREEFRRTATIRAALPTGPQPVDRWFVSVPTVTAAPPEDLILRLAPTAAQMPDTLKQAYRLDATALHAPEHVEMLARRAGQVLGVSDSKNLYTRLVDSAGATQEVDPERRRGPQGAEARERAPLVVSGDDDALRDAISKAVAALYDAQHYGPHVLLLKPDLLNRYRSLVNSKDGRGFVSDSLGADLKVALVPKDAAGDNSLGALVSLSSASVDVVVFDAVGLSVTAYGAEGELTLLAQTRVALRLLDKKSIVHFKKAI